MTPERGAYWLGMFGFAIAETVGWVRATRRAEDICFDAHEISCDSDQIGVELAWRVGSDKYFYETPPFPLQSQTRRRR